MAEILNLYVDLIADLPRPATVDEAPGEELARLLAAALPKHGITVLEVAEPDIAHYIECRAGESTIELMIGLDTLTVEDRWFIQPCVQRSFFGRQKWRDGDLRRVLFAVDQTLKGLDRVTDVRWFPYFDDPDILELLQPSDGPVRDTALDEKLPLLIRCDRFLGRLWSPLSITLVFALIVAVAAVAPTVAGVIALIYIVGVIFVAPAFLSYLISNAAQRKNRKDAGTMHGD